MKKKRDQNEITWVPVGNRKDMTKGNDTTNLGKVERTFASSSESLDIICSKNSQNLAQHIPLEE